MNFNGIMDTVCVAFSFCFIIYTIFTTITRHLSVRSQNALHEKIFDKLNATPAMGELVASGALQPFLASLTPAPEKTALNLPASRILRGIQIGIVLTCFGVGMLFLHKVLHQEDAGLGFLVFGIGALGLGLGFIIAAGASVWLSRRLGVLDREPTA
jgi:hypothetical protein